ncbi:HlyD family efflux transporter periplasmic adaptor subunit [uncultured Sphingomonas sp.]|uniref:HlyD family secretion protein n=1 Tax=uncultured Sphingomonas sp. TaxID=158754 RepID=UPI0025DC2A53|nr:HlyD family efflux transporter periplasmic adaptor subunit [uncultured Sphingomonas sp.]
METVAPMFRQEVAEHRAERLQGTVRIFIPQSWQIIGYTMMVFAIVVLVFAFQASYARVETVSGSVVLDKGVATILPSRPGVVTALKIKDGTSVSLGDRLVEVRSEEGFSRAETGSERIAAALSEQDRRLANQASFIAAAAVTERARLGAEIVGTQNELADLSSQIDVQHRLVEVAANEFSQVQRLASSGFISRRDLEAREAALLSRRQQLSQLRQLESLKNADLAKARLSIEQAVSSAQAQVAGVESGRAALRQQLAQAEIARGYWILSPVSGTVTALTARVGQTATPSQPLMAIIPTDATARAELYVPSSAAGFLSIGQEVHIGLDAFPFQRFGTVRGRIAQVSTTAIPRSGPDGRVAPVYLVTAELDVPYVTAFGRRQRVSPGMGLTARIVAEKQNLIHWLFEPIYAVAKR